ncbi:hypothetical protein ODQ96_25795, partial [Escherichia coli]|nr:hypothetical protein [Escherichia coli]
MECQNRSDKYIWSPHDAYFYKGLSELIVDIDRLIYLSLEKIREGANKRGNSSRLTQSFHFFMFEPIFSPVNALN